MSYSIILRKALAVLDYCFYRITYFYLSSRYNGYRYYNTRICGGITFIILAFLFLSIVLCPLSAIVKTDLITYPLFWWKRNTPAAWIILLFYISGNIYGSKDRYQRLSERYRGESLSKMKGWGVAGIIVMVFVIYCVSILLFVRPLHAIAC